MASSLAVQPPRVDFRKNELEGIVGEGAETVEPILDSFGGYSTDNLSNFYFPYIIVLLMIFRNEVGFDMKSNTQLVWMIDCCNFQHSLGDT